MKYCKNCGSKLQPGANYCLECGKKVDEDSINETKIIKERRKGLPIWSIILIIILSLVVFFGIVFAAIGTYSYDYIEDEVEETRSETVGTVGDTVYGDIFNIKLLEAKKFVTITTEDKVYTPDNGKIFIAIYIEAENKTISSESFNMQYLKTYIDDKEISPKFLNLEINNYEPMGGEILPSEKMAGYILYEVPNDFSRFKVTYKEKYFDSESKLLTFKVNNSY